MGNEDTTDDALDDRRRFVRGLREHEDVRRLTFTRDGFETVLLELEPGAGFREEWHRTATRLGYTVGSGRSSGGSSVASEDRTLSVSGASTAPSRGGRGTVETIASTPTGPVRCRIHRLRRR
jgi:hypothetical protein